MTLTQEQQELLRRAAVWVQLCAMVAIIVFVLVEEGQALAGYRATPSNAVEVLLLAIANINITTLLLQRDKK